MAKLPAKEFFKIIREIVRDEVKKQLPGMVKECLTENYLRQMVTEIARGSNRGRPSLEEQLVGDPEIEVQPEALSNTDDGIYQKHRLLKPGQREAEGKPAGTNEVVKRLFAKDPGMATLFEGTSPLPREGEAPAVGEVPSKIIEQLVDPEKVRALLGQSEQTSRQVTADARVQFEEQRLARLRESLDRPVNGGAPRPRVTSISRPRPQIADVVTESTEDPFAPVGELQ